MHDVPGRVANEWNARRALLCRVFPGERKRVAGRQLHGMRARQVQWPDRPVCLLAVHSR